MSKQSDTERKAGMGPLQKLEAICEEIFERWDKDQRSGKLLSALAGRLTAYRADVTEVREALNAHSDMKAALEWQPIETAPKDGTFIDVWIGGDIEQRYTDIQWRKPTESELWVSGSEEPDASQGEYGPEEGFFECHGLKLQGGLYPTHWRLPPEPPALSKLTGGGG